ncbi:hypothetical protein H8356DRAFT_1292054 [Neocallimastix lanati (nom. inval.)]|nr:hypothetical protein H8356DRAFT_1292054 [Neocallimastix sp. JGI-2020a]
MVVATFQYIRILGYQADKITILTTYNDIIEYFKSEKLNKEDKKKEAEEKETEEANDEYENKEILNQEDKKEMKYGKENMEKQHEKK